MQNIDLLIIGGGPAGYETAVRAGKAGLNTVLVEARQLGGTCLNEGCIPTKCLCHVAETIESLKKSSSVGIKCQGMSFDFNKAQQHKNQVVSMLREGVGTMLKSAHVEVVYGMASFKTPHSIVVKTAQGALELEAANIIIATGSESKILDIDGANIDGVLTSREMLNIDKVPQSLCVIGGGVIGMEFASIFSAFGTKVTVVEFCPEILPNFDRDLAKRLRLLLKKKNIEFYTKAAVTNITSNERGLQVHFDYKDSEHVVEAEKVLMATGRSANMKSLELENAGVEYGKKGIVVDKNFQTSSNGVYAIGDVNGIAQLAHVAKFQGIHVLSHILGQDDSINFDVIPAAVFTSPEASFVGLTEEMLKDKGISYVSHKSFYRANGRALSQDAAEGYVKILTSTEGQVLGAHILGAHASELIHEFSLLMSRSGKLSDILNTIHAHPTLSELIFDAAEN